MFSVKLYQITSLLKLQTFFSDKNGFVAFFKDMLSIFYEPLKILL